PKVRLESLTYFLAGVIPLVAGASRLQRPALCPGPAPEQRPRRRPRRGRGPPRAHFPSPSPPFPRGRNGPPGGDAFSRKAEPDGTCSFALLTAPVTDIASTTEPSDRGPLDTSLATFPVRLVPRPFCRIIPVAFSSPVADRDVQA